MRACPRAMEPRAGHRHSRPLASLREVGTEGGGLTMYRWDWCEFADGMFIFYVNAGEMGDYEIGRSVAPWIEYVADRQVA
jgi:hypothetical protein